MVMPLHVLMEILNVFTRLDEDIGILLNICLGLRKICVMLLFSKKKKKKKNGGREAMFPSIHSPFFQVLKSLIW